MATRLAAGQLLAHCLAKPGAWADNPWDHEHPVVKVGTSPGAGKIFAFLGESTVGVKAGRTRDEADESYALVVSLLPRLHRPDGWQEA